MTTNRSASIRLPQRPPEPDWIRLDREQELESKLRGNPAILQRASRIAGDLAEASVDWKRRHLASSLRITKSVSPTLTKTFEAAKRILAVDRPCELYVEASSELNAFCVVLPDGEIAIVATASLLERMSSQEHLFLFGHELGHALLGHHQIPVNGLIKGANGDEGLPWKLALQLLSWSRACEISCDRFGLLCCQDAQVARRALLKLASGLPGRLLGEGDEFETQVELWESHRRDDDDVQLTHPIVPLRARCVRIFADSAYFSELFGAGYGAPGVSASSADDETQRELQRMDPDPDLLEQCESTELRRDLVALGGLYVMVADGDVSEAEQNGLVQLAGSEPVLKAVHLLKEEGGKALAREARRAAQELRGKVELSDRMTALATVMLVAFLDQRLHEAEHDVLRGLAQDLGIPDAFLSTVLYRLQSGENPLL